MYELAVAVRLRQSVYAFNWELPREFSIDDNLNTLVVNTAPCHCRRCQRRQDGGNGCGESASLLCILSSGQLDLLGTPSAVIGAIGVVH